MTKLYASRDSATSVLRKLGVKPRDYDLFITKVDNKFECQISAATAHLESLKPPAPVVKKPAAKKSAKAKKPGKPTVGSVAKNMILNGKSNAEVLVVLVQHFNIDEKKKYYPSWYRGQLRRKGFQV